MTEVGHVAQIQKNVIHPKNKNVMASAGFDGSVRKWNLQNMQMECMFEHRSNSAQQQLIIQSLAWCVMDPPRDQARDAYDNLIAIGTSDGKVCLLDIARNKIVNTIQLPS